MNRRIVVSLVVAASFISSCTHAPTATKAPPVAVHQRTTPRVPSSELKDTPWTTWSTDKGTVGGLLVLSHIRKELLKNNLYDPHVNYAGYKDIDCSKQNIQFRSADGTCNDIKNPWVGAAGVAFGRNVPPEYIDKNADEKIMTPDPAMVSKEFFTRDEFKPVPFLNMLAAVWIQFMNHDWLTHGKNMESGAFRVDKDNGTTEYVERTKENENDSRYKTEFGKVSLNDVTHWWDASQIYGSSLAAQMKLRSGVDGRMRTDVVNGREILPKRNDLDVKNNKQNQGYEMTGFNDNWWMGLSMLHTLFVKEHNAIADMLMKKYVSADKGSGKFIWKNGKDVKYLDQKQMDEQVFQVARLINSAILAKIHTIEWTPAILANHTLKRGMFTNWYGVVNPSTWSKMLRSFPALNKTEWSDKNQSYLIGGIVGQRTDNFGVPFSITEEFTSVYRLHSLLPETLNLTRLSNKAQVESVKFADSRNEKAYDIMATHDFKDLFYSFGTQLPGQLVLNNFPKFMQELEIPGHGVMDLGMVDVMRDRERGVPRYNQFRRAIGLKPIATYRDFFHPSIKKLNAKQEAVIQKFEKVYGVDQYGNDNVEMIDLLVGTLAEEVRPKNFGFGETMFQIFILMASRRLMADRFFTEYYKPEYYTKAGLDWIDDEGTLKKVIGRHMPELKPKMAGIETAFNPWKK